jgi:hypothetical protein
MNTSTVLRICVVLEWVFAGSGIALSLLLESALPDPLRQWLSAELEKSLNLHDVLLLFLIVPLLLCAIVSSIGLFLLKRWAAWLYLGTVIVGFLLYPLMGPTVEHALADAVDDIAVVLSGLIIGLAFFSDALKPKARVTDGV